MSPIDPWGDAQTFDGHDRNRFSLGIFLKLYRLFHRNENEGRRNYRKADNINFLDGDEPDYVTYNYGVTSMVDDQARVIKGGSWKDRAYWMSPGTRRYLDQRQSTDYIGFRCAMHRVGSPVGFAQKGRKSKSAREPVHKQNIKTSRLR